MNKKDTARNYAIWVVMVIFYIAFYFFNNQGWKKEIPISSSKSSILSSSQFPNGTSQKMDSLPGGSLDSPYQENSEPDLTIENSESEARQFNRRDRESVRKKAEPVHINHATESEWQTLYNIGPYRSEKIVNFRRALGGFHSVDQVGETYALPDSVFQEIKSQLILLDSNRIRIPINYRSYDSLYLHPYITKQMAYFMVRHRENSNALRTMDDLYGIIQEKDHERLRKLEPYLDFRIK